MSFQNQYFHGQRAGTSPHHRLASNSITKRFVGLFGAAVTLAFAISLFSWVAPSRSATGDGAENWLGSFGNMIASESLEVLGLGVVAVLIILYAWSRLLLLGRLPHNYGLALVMCPIAITSVACFLAYIPAPDSWAISSGLGGSLGHETLDYVKTSGLLDDSSSVTIWLFLAIIAAGTMYLAKAFSPFIADGSRATRRRHEESDGAQINDTVVDRQKIFGYQATHPPTYRRGRIISGMLGHYFFNAKAQLNRSKSALYNRVTSSVANFKSSAGSYAGQKASNSNASYAGHAGYTGHAGYDANGNPNMGGSEQPYHPYTHSSGHPAHNHSSHGHPSYGHSSANYGAPYQRQNSAHPDAYAANTNGGPPHNYAPNAYKPNSYSPGTTDLDDEFEDDNGLEESEMNGEFEHEMESNSAFGHYNNVDPNASNQHPGYPMQGVNQGVNHGVNQGMNHGVNHGMNHPSSAHPGFRHDPNAAPMNGQMAHQHSQPQYAPGPHGYPAGQSPGHPHGHPHGHPLGHAPTQAGANATPQKKSLAKRAFERAQIAFSVDNPSSQATSDGDFKLPLPGFLIPPKPNAQSLVSEAALGENAKLLEHVLADFGVKGEIMSVNPGPVVTLYELQPAAGLKSARVIGLADDIARSMSAVSARVAVVPGRNVIGIELPNETRITVYLRELIDSPQFTNTSAALPVCLGKNIGGSAIIADLAKMPHLLIAGTTGSGKSVAVNTMILSLLYRLSPEDCRLIMIDPKMLELSVYDGVPHLLSPVVTDPTKAVQALKWAVREMEDRYRKMSKLGVRNIGGYNERVAEAAASGEPITKSNSAGFDKKTGEPIFEEEELNFEKLPYIVVIVDEMADLMMVAGKEIESAVQRLAQMARAAGIHIVMATQRPSVDVITGTIKANFPTRISFQVTSKIDSRTILGEQGAEQLLGQGDMLYMSGGGKITRIHAPFVSDSEVEQVVHHLKSQRAPEYLTDVTDESEDDDILKEDPLADIDGNGDLYQQAVAIVVRDKKASTSYVQRRLQIGYNRAATLIERMEKEGVISPANHAGKRVIVGTGSD